MTDVSQSNNDVLVRNVVAVSQNAALAEGGLDATQLRQIVDETHELGFSMAEARAFAAGVNSAVVLGRLSHQNDGYWDGYGRGLNAARRAVEDGRAIPTIEDYE